MRSGWFLWSARECHEEKIERELNSACQLNNHYMIILIVTNLVDISRGRLFRVGELSQKNMGPAM
jgi:hypothetical protein